MHFTVVVNGSGWYSSSPRTVTKFMLDIAKNIKLIAIIITVIIIPYIFPRYLMGKLVLIVLRPSSDAELHNN